MPFNRSKNSFLFPALLGLHSGLMILGAVLPPSKLPMFLLRWNDKAVHGAEFFLLYSLVQKVFKKNPRLILGYGLAMAGLTESLQFLSPYRSPEVWDLLADAAGYGLAALLFKGWERGKRNL